MIKEFFKHQATEYIGICVQLVKLIVSAPVGQKVLKGCNNFHYSFCNVIKDLLCLKNPQSFLIIYISGQPLGGFLSYSVLIWKRSKKLMVPMVIKPDNPALPSSSIWCLRNLGFTILEYSVSVSVWVRT